MKSWLRILVVVSVFTLVESCWHFNILRKNYERKCEKWWNKAQKYAGDRHRSIKRCVYLIRDKCPSALKISDFSVTKDVKKHYTVWDRTKEVTHVSLDGRVRFRVKEKRGVCANDDGGDGDCDFWWKAASWKKAQTHMIERCVTQVLNHCPDDIEKVNEEHKSKQKLDEVIHITTLTYRYKNTEVTYRHLDYEKKT